MPDASAAPEGGHATVLAAVAGDSSDKGDYKATSLSPSSSWQISPQSGDFNWSYPLRTPQVPGGLQPQLALGYSSSTIDGRTSNTSGQPSWVGDGFDLWPGYIQRSYKACKDDGAPKDPTYGTYPGDQCWGYDNAVMSLGGKGGELIPAGGGKWKLKNDDGTRIERVNGTEANTDNGDNDNEYWKVTTTDGTQYYFGKNRWDKGWASGKPETNSTWTAPVFGNNDKEPCNEASGFADSWCPQAYRWNLDFVVDTDGNAVVYYYGTETNHYARNLKEKDETPYVRGGYLLRTEYGLKEANPYAKAPARVDFEVSERCIRENSADCAEGNIKEHPDYWWDVPWDLNCEADKECKHPNGSASPTFWSRKRLTNVTTSIIKPDGSGYRPVDSWKLKHAWGMADVDRQMLLESVVHSGEAGGDRVEMPPVSFVYKQLVNRVDELGDNLGPFVKNRLATVYNETGGVLDVSYSAEDCTTSSLPNPADNHRRCFPVYWVNGTNADKPALDWFHKYAVTQSVQTDLTGKAPDVVTDYDYSIGQPAWHFDDDDGLTPEKYKTWSQWRGFSKARVTVRNPTGTASQSDHWYMQGMHGDRASPDSDAKKSVGVSNGEANEPVYPDHESLQGFEVRSVTYSKPGGSVLTKTINYPWHDQTASRTRSWGTVTANLTGVKSSRAITSIDNGGDWRETKTTTNSFNTTTGTPLEVDDFGDVAKSDDDRCTTTNLATANTTDWIVALPSHVRTIARKCADKDNADLSKDLLSDQRTFYDNGALDAAPTRGNATLVEKPKSATASAVTYITAAKTKFDSYGRSIESTDSAGKIVKTDYTDPQGLTTKVANTTPLANPQDPNSFLETSTEFDPAWASPLVESDAGSKQTKYQYDALGRVTKVWGPNRTTGQTPDREFAYKIKLNEIVAVTTKRLTNTSGQETEYALLDGWLRPRQTQEPGPAGGRLITDTFYNAQGKVDRSYDTYYADAVPSTTLFGVDKVGDVETQAVYEYDGVGRTTAQRLLVGNSDANEKWHTSYAYGGNYTTVTPPEGAYPSTTYVDARGQTTELRQYKGTGPSDYASTKYEYTPAGQLAKLTAHGGQVWTHDYDLRGRKIESNDPDKGVTKYTYDDLDQLTQVEDARGKKIGYSYDGLGRKTSLFDQTTATPGTKLAEWTYDTVRKGLPATSTRYDGTATYTTKVNFYDNLNRPTSTTTTLTGLPAAEGSLAPANGYTFTTTYGLDGTVRTAGMPAAGGLGGESLVYTNDDYGRSTTLKSNLSDYVLKTDYLNDGKLIGQLLGTSSSAKKVSHSYTYEHGTKRLKTATTVHDGQAGFDRSATYSYHDAGNVKQITDVSRSGTDNQCFRYDHFQRLTDAWTQNVPPDDTATCATDPSQASLGGPAPYRVNYTYDETGNRKSETNYTATGQVTSTRNYTYANGPGVDPKYKGHQLANLTQTGEGAHSETYDYDASGNTTGRTTASGKQTLTWDAEGELTKVSDTAKGDTTYAYTAEGERLIRRDPKGTTLYLPGTEIHLPKGTTTPKATRYYSHDGETIAMRDASGVTFLVSDHQGTASQEINAATGALTQRRFTPFGQNRGTPLGTWLGEKGFVGGTIDSATDLTNLGARQYDPTTGRFISVDPVITQGDPQQMNGYTYAKNNPVTHADPTGLMVWEPAPAPGGPSSPGEGGLRGDSPGGGGGGGTNNASTGGGGGSPWQPLKKLVKHGWNFYVGAMIGGSKSGLAGPVGYAFLIPGVENKFARLVGADPNSKMYFGGSIAPDIAMAVMSIGAASRAATAIAARVGLGGGRFAIPKPRVKVDPPGASAGGKAAGGANGGTAARGGSSATPRAGSSAGAGSKGGKAPGRQPAGKGEGCSFLAGTAVVLADGTRKAIDHIKIGDKVLATDPETGKTTPRPVLDTIVGAGTKTLVQLTIDSSATKKSKSGVLISTDNHPFWVVDKKQWLDAGQLKPGMWLRTSAGTHVQITAIKTWTKYQQVYNLTVETDPTYYVVAGTTPVLVHNCRGGSGADNAANAAKLKRFYSQAQKYGQGGIKELESGRIRFYGNVTPARNPGEMIGRRLVREWDPGTDATRIWHETLDGFGNVRIVRPDVNATGGKKIHYLFDVDGYFTGTF
ncbi:polymorphic toxin-type HINT domain-containing protein [Actinomadura sp. 6N118]|uniref:polymorphic toxin-type HINT domain-containing protein n=1 Tax=Actinomadura sp. 6N118 TaxID=3375151 RepID=UPI0037B90C57